MQEIKYYISALYLSLFSRNFYAELIANKNIMGIKYLLLLALIVSTPIALEVKYLFKNIFTSEGVGIDESVDHILKQLPEISIKEGKIITSLKDNLTITSRSGDIIAIFDVQNKLTALDNYESILVISEDSVRVRMPDDAGTAVLLARDIEEIFRQYNETTEEGNKFNLIKLFTDVKHILKTPLPLIIILASLWFWLRYIFSAFVYSFMAGIFLSIMCKKNSFDLKLCFRVAAFTLTPVALLEMFSNMMGGGLFSYATLVYFITHILYMYFAVESYRKLKS